MFVAVVSNVYQLYLILTNRENTSCVDKYILRVASVVRCVAAQYRVHIMTIPSFEDGSFHPSCVSRKCRRFRLYAVPCAVRMLYDLGVLALFVTLARSHVFRIGFRTRTVCCGDRGASSFAVRSWYDLYISCRCWRNAFTFPSDRDDMAGRFDLYLIPFRSSHGDGRLWSIGVVMRHNIAK